MKIKNVALRNAVLLLLFTSCQRENLTPPATNTTQEDVSMLERTSSCQTPSTNLMPAVVDTRITLWKDGYIPYYIIESGFNSTQIQNIRDAAKAWCEKTGAVVISPVNSGAAQVKVVSASSGCSATVGNKFPNEMPTINLSNTCDLISTKHEFGHIVGLIHEHQRSIRNNYLILPAKTYQYIKTNFPSLQNAVITNLRPEKPTTYTDPFPYDFSSVMHYGSYPRNNVNLANALISTNNPLYINKSNCSEIKRPTDISEKDINLVRHLYPRYYKFGNNTNLTIPVWIRYTNGTASFINLKKGDSFLLQYDYESQRYYNTSNSKLVTLIDLNSGRPADDIDFRPQDNKIVYFPASNSVTMFDAYKKAYTTKLVNGNVYDNDGINGNTNIKLYNTLNGNRLETWISNR